MITEGVHYPMVRTLTLDELCQKYEAAQSQYWRSAKLWAKHKCNEVGMTVYAEYMLLLWNEIERRTDDELETELLEFVYENLPL